MLFSSLQCHQLWDEQELAWWWKCSLLSCLDLDNSNYFGIRKSRISLFIIHRKQISTSADGRFQGQAGVLSAVTIPTATLLGPDWSLPHETVTEMTQNYLLLEQAQCGLAAEVSQDNIQILTHQILLLLLQEIIELTMPTCVTQRWPAGAEQQKKADTHTLTVTHIFPHWSMRTLHNNVSQWFGPAPPPPLPSEHEKSLFSFLPHSKTKFIFFLEKRETTNQPLLKKKFK